MINKQVVRVNKQGIRDSLRYAEYSSKDGGYCTYAVYGEDPNCDMGGSHICPFLGNVEGTFSEVLEYAANEMKGFYAWGGGGHIRPVKDLNESVEPIVLNSTKKLKRERKEKLNNLTKVDFENLISEFDMLSKSEIKNRLIEIKNRL